MSFLADGLSETYMHIKSARFRHALMQKPDSSWSTCSVSLAVAAVTLEVVVGNIS